MSPHDSASSHNHRHRARLYVASLCTVVGASISVWVCTMAQSPSLGLSSWIVGPWVITAMLVIAKRRSAGMAIGTALMLALEVLSYFDAFVRAGSSTAPLIYVAKAPIQLLICLPFGFAGARLTRGLRADCR